MDTVKVTKIKNGYKSDKIIIITGYKIILKKETTILKKSTNIGIKRKKEIVLNVCTLIM